MAPNSTKARTAPTSLAAGKRSPANGASANSASARPRPRSKTGAAGSEVGARIDFALREKGLSQSDLARKLAGPLAEPTRVESIRRLIGKWRGNEHVPCATYALHLAEIFDKPRSYFAPQAAAEIDATDRPSRSSAEIDAIDFIRQAAACVNEVSETTLELPRTKKDIAKLVPHFNSDRILMDRVVELVAGEKIVAEKKFSERDWELGSWYAGTSIVPGVLLVEALAQAGALVLLTEPQNR